MDPENGVNVAVEMLLGESWREHVGYLVSDGARVELASRSHLCTVLPGQRPGIVLFKLQAAITSIKYIVEVRRGVNILVGMGIFS